MAGPAVVWWVLGVIPLGCGPAAPTDTGGGGEELCDGSTDLRLIARSKTLGQEPQDVVFHHELGHEYLYVLGTCEFFVLPVDAQQLREYTRVGVLERADADALAEVLSYTELGELEGYYPDASTGSVAQVSDGVHTVVCNNNCPEAPAQVREMRSALSSWTRRLWDDGAPYTGPIRLAVHPEMSEWKLPGASAWEGKQALGNLEYDRPYDYWVGTSTVLDDPADTSWLRRVWETHADQQGGLSVLFTEGGASELYDVWMRDALPFENAQGLVPVSVPCTAEGSCGLDGAACVDGYCRGASCTQACGPLTPCVDRECVEP